MGIFLEQEMGVIGWFHADVSAYVIDHRRGEAVEAAPSAPMFPSVMNQKYCSSFFKHGLSFATRGHCIIRVTEEDGVSVDEE